MTNRKFMIIAQPLRRILRAIRRAGGRPLIVGGSVRDALIAMQVDADTPSKDIDVEVFGISRLELKAVLSQFGDVSDVGESFAVIKLRAGRQEFDFSLPRRDNKTGRGHKEFEVEVDHTMTPREAAKRRDFTINAISFDPFSGELIDPFGGIEDLRKRILRPTSEHFAEDPLRILRGFQFAARFNLTWTPELEALGRQLKPEFATLAQERVREEWLKWAGRGVKPSQGLKFLKAVGWLEFFPEVAALDGVLQDVIWHPEGDVFEHTCHVVDAMAWQCDREGIEGDRRVRLMFGALCHDFGKATNTWLATRRFRWHWTLMTPVAKLASKFMWRKWLGEWRWRSPAHDQMGEEPTRAFMDRLFKTEDQKRETEMTEDVVALVVTHMRHIGLKATAKSVRRLSRDVFLNDMEQVVNADSNGRPFDPDTWEANPSMVAILEKAEELAVKDQQPQPILMGRHLIEMGMKPSRQFGVIISGAFEAQLDGDFDDVEGAKAWVAMQDFDGEG